MRSMSPLFTGEDESVLDGGGGGGSSGADLFASERQNPLALLLTWLIYSLLFVTAIVCVSLRRVSSPYDKEEDFDVGVCRAVNHDDDDVVAVEEDGGEGSGDGGGDGDNGALNVAANKAAPTAVAMATATATATATTAASRDEKEETGKATATEDEGAPPISLSSAVDRIVAATATAVVAASSCGSSSSSSSLSSRSTASSPSCHDYGKGGVRRGGDANATDDYGVMTEDEEQDLFVVQSWRGRLTTPTKPARATTFDNGDQAAEGHQRNETAMSEADVSATSSSSAPVALSSSPHVSANETDVVAETIADGYGSGNDDQDNEQFPPPTVLGRMAAANFFASAPDSSYTVNAKQWQEEKERAKECGPALQRVHGSEQAPHDRELAVEPCDDIIEHTKQMYSEENAKSETPEQQEGPIVEAATTETKELPRTENTCPLGADQDKTNETDDIVEIDGTGSRNNLHDLSITHPVTLLQEMIAPFVEKSAVEAAPRNATTNDTDNTEAVSPSTTRVDCPPEKNARGDGTDATTSASDESHSDKDVQDADNPNGDDYGRLATNGDVVYDPALGRCVYADTGHPAYVCPGERTDVVPEPYLKAHRGDAARAERAWNATQKWRRDSGVWSIHGAAAAASVASSSSSSLSDSADAGQTHGNGAANIVVGASGAGALYESAKEAYPQFLHGRSKTGRPVLYLRPGEMNLKCDEGITIKLKGGQAKLDRSDDVLRYHIFLMEYVRHCLGSSQTQEEAKEAPTPATTATPTVVEKPSGIVVNSETGNKTVKGDKNEDAKVDRDNNDSLSETSSTSGKNRSEDGLTIVLDMRDASRALLNMECMACLRNIRDVDASHYPGVIDCVLLINTPFWLGGAWLGGVGAQIVPEDVSVEWVQPPSSSSSSSKKTKGRLGQWIDDDEIPPEYGGSSPYRLGDHPFEIRLATMAKKRSVSVGGKTD